MFFTRSLFSFYFDLKISRQFTTCFCLFLVSVLMNGYAIILIVLTVEHKFLLIYYGYHQEQQQAVADKGLAYDETIILMRDLPRILRFKKFLSARRRLNNNNLERNILS